MSAMRCDLRACRVDPMAADSPLVAGRRRARAAGRRRRRGRRTACTCRPRPGATSGACGAGTGTRRGPCTVAAAAPGADRPPVAGAAGGAGGRTWAGGAGRPSGLRPECGAGVDAADAGRSVFGARAGACFASGAIVIVIRAGRAVHRPLAGNRRPVLCTAPADRAYRHAWGRLERHPQRRSCSRPRPVRRAAGVRHPRFSRKRQAIVRAASGSLGPR